MRVHEAAPPGELADMLRELASLDDEGLADELAEAERDLRVAQAKRAAVVTAVHDRIETMGYRMSGATETVAAITVCSTRSASFLMEASLSICDRPKVWAALCAGSIDAGRARVIADGFYEVPDPDRDVLESRALAYAATHTTHQTRQRVTRLLVDHDPRLAVAERQRERAKAWDKRHIGVHAREHGMAALYGYLPTGTAQLLIAALEEVAGRYSDDRTMDQKRVDALAEVLSQNSHLDIHVDVVIPADTLAGWQDSGASIDGFGAVDADHARALALHRDARWQRLVTDPLNGRLTDLSKDAYRIPDALKRAVRARDRRCRFPGCSTPARSTDTDHVVPWPDGPTAERNLAPECRGHHRVKTHSGWRCRMHEDGSMTWISPLGTEHTTHVWDYNDPEG